MDIAAVNVVNAAYGPADRQTPTPAADNAVVAPSTVQSETVRAQAVQKSDRPAGEGSNQDTKSPDAGIRFENLAGHRVMKVSDNKGVLIYQAPPKGELQLILEQEGKAYLLETQA